MAFAMKIYWLRTTQCFIEENIVSMVLKWGIKSMPMFFKWSWIKSWYVQLTSNIDLQNSIVTQWYKYPAKKWYRAYGYIPPMQFKRDSVFLLQHKMGVHQLLLYMNIKSRWESCQGTTNFSPIYILPLVSSITKTSL